MAAMPNAKVSTWCSPKRLTISGIHTRTTNAAAENAAMIMPIFEADKPIEWP